MPTNTPAKRASSANNQLGFFASVLSLSVFFSPKASTSSSLNNFTILGFISSIFTLTILPPTFFAPSSAKGFSPSCNP